MTGSTQERMTPQEGPGPEVKKKGSFNKVRFSEMLDDEEEDPIVDYQNSMQVTNSQIE